MKFLNEIESALASTVDEYQFNYAAAAWRGYIQHGRGFIVSYLEKVPPPDNAKTDDYYRLRYEYLHLKHPYIDAIDEAIEGGLEKLRGLMNQYDPAEDFVCVVFHKGEEDELHGLIGGYTPDITPPAAYAAVIARPEEFDLELYD